MIFFFKTTHQSFSNISSQPKTNPKVDTYIANCPKNTFFLKKPLAYPPQPTLAPLYATKTTHPKLDTCPKVSKKCPIFALHLSNSVQLSWTALLLTTIQPKPKLPFFCVVKSN
jgi:hypothetical protein